MGEKTEEGIIDFKKSKTRLEYSKQISIRDNSQNRIIWKLEGIEERDIFKRDKMRQSAGRGTKEQNIVILLLWTWGHGGASFQKLV